MNFEKLLKQPNTLPSAPKALPSAPLPSGPAAKALPAAKSQLVALAEALTPRDRPGDYAQAVMDLGATVCTRSAM